MIKKITDFFKKEIMLSVSLLAAATAIIIFPFDINSFKGLDWKTLATLFMMLTVLESFKKENIFEPLIKKTEKIKTVTGLSLFLIFSVFFSSMFVTNDVSLIIFVPLTIMLFRAADKEKYILPVISMENIAAIRGSLLTPFGSPQNLFIFGQSGVSAKHFITKMSPIWIMSAILLVAYVFIMYRKNPKEKMVYKSKTVADNVKSNKIKKAVYITLFALIVTTIVSRTQYWWVITVVVALTVFFTDKTIFLKTDYVLLLTFLCFFVFSSAITGSEKTAAFLSKLVEGHEYISAILLSQIVSNVPAAIILYPFSKNTFGLLYGLDTAGLCSLIGSLASVINYRIYVREYPQKGKVFIKVFTLISLIFFAVVALPGYFLGKI